MKKVLPSAPVVLTALSLLACGCAANGETAASRAPAATPPAQAQARPALTPAEQNRRDTLLSLFRAYEYVPQKSDLDRLGTPAEVTASLTDLAGDTSVSPHVRIQALASLGFYPSPESKRVLEATITAPETSNVLRRSALRAFGSGFKAEAVPLLSRYLDHSDMHSRTAAVRALGQIKTPDAATALRRRLGSEPEATVKATIAAELAKFDDPAAPKSPQRKPR
jgi:HEAT repeats